MRWEERIQIEHGSTWCANCSATFLMAYNLKVFEVPCEVVYQIDKLVLDQHLR